MAGLGNEGAGGDDGGSGAEVEGGGVRKRGGRSVECPVVVSEGGVK